MSEKQCFSPGRLTTRSYPHFKEQNILFVLVVYYAAGIKWKKEWQGLKKFKKKEKKRLV